MSSASKVNSFTRRAHSHLYFWRQRAIDAVVLEIPNEDRDGTNSTINIKKIVKNRKKMETTDVLYLKSSVLNCYNKLLHKTLV